jgi:hypothetical protein
MELDRFAKAFDREEFVNSGLSLFAAFLLADHTYEGAGQIPPHVLELDCQGSIADTYGPRGVVEWGGNKVQSKL